MNTNNEKTPEQVARTAAIQKTIEIGICILGLTALFLALVGCTPKRGDVPTYWGNTPQQALEASKLHARDIGGAYSIILPTGSMEPKITGGDYIVYVNRPYSSVKVGMLAIYKARWLPPKSSQVCHWVSAKQGDEWIMDGEANRAYENKRDQLMGEKEFIGEVVAIYTTREKP